MTTPSAAVEAPSRSLARLWSRSSAALFGALLAGCASQSGDLLRPGVSDQSPQAPDRVKLAPAASAESWDQTSQLPAFPLIDDRQLPSRGHNPPYWSGTVRVSPTLEPLYQKLGPSTVVPPGAVAVESHVEASGTEQSHFVMIKRDPGFDPQGGDWEYLVVAPDGRIQNRGVLPLCSRCHADAPADHLFGPRLSSRRHVGPDTPPGGEALVGNDDDEALSPPEDEAPGSKSSGKPTTRPKGKKRKGH